jgi:hypothetical protein
MVRPHEGQIPPSCLSAYRLETIRWLRTEQLPQCSRPFHSGEFHREFELHVRDIVSGNTDGARWGKIHGYCTGRVPAQSFVQTPQVVPPGSTKRLVPQVEFVSFGRLNVARSAPAEPVTVESMSLPPP